MLWCVASILCVASRSVPCAPLGCWESCRAPILNADVDSHQSKIEEETGNRGLRKSFEELCGVYLYVVQAKHEALTRELQLYQTLFNPALRQVRPSHISVEH